MRHDMQVQFKVPLADNDSLVAFEQLLHELNGDESTPSLTVKIQVANATPTAVRAVAFCMSALAKAQEDLEARQQPSLFDDPDPRDQPPSSANELPDPLAV